MGAVDAKRFLEKGKSCRGPFSVAKCSAVSSDTGQFSATLGTFFRTIFHLPGPLASPKASRWPVDRPLCSFAGWKDKPKLRHRATAPEQDSTPPSLQVPSTQVTTALAGNPWVGERLIHRQNIRFQTHIPQWPKSPSGPHNCMSPVALNPPGQAVIGCLRMTVLSLQIPEFNCRLLAVHRTGFKTHTLFLVGHRL